MQIMGDFLYVNLFDHHRSRWKKYQVIFQSYIARGCHHLRFFQSRKAKSFNPFDFKGTFLFEKNVLRQLRDIICMRLPDNVAYLKHLVQFWVSISLQLKIDKCGPFTTWEGK